MTLIASVVETLFNWHFYSSQMRNVHSNLLVSAVFILYPDGERSHMFLTWYFVPRKDAQIKCLCVMSYLYFPCYQNILRKRNKRRRGKESRQWDKRETKMWWSVCQTARAYYILFSVWHTSLIGLISVVWKRTNSSKLIFRAVIISRVAGNLWMCLRSFLASI